jgi:succinate dehydrogenase / fumarate reductase cytochrome b subunit
MSTEKEKLSTAEIIRKRPLSPHLTIYRPQISSLLSITHRATGFYLYFGLIFFCWFLYFISYKSCCMHPFLEKMQTNIIFHFLIFTWSVAFFYHFSNGIRHLFWDIGLGLEIKSMNCSGWMVIISTILLTSLTWFLVIFN